MPSPKKRGRPDALLSTSHKILSADGGSEAPVLHPAWIADHPDCVPHTILPLSELLGLPLLGCIYTPNRHSEVKQPDLEPMIVDTPYNPVLHDLSCMKSPFQTYQIPRPNILLARVDGKELPVEHVAGMWVFITETQSKLPNYEEFLAEMTPEKFTKFWEEHPVYKLCDGGCPVNDEDLGFVACTSQKYRVASSEHGIHLPYVEQTGGAINSSCLQDACSPLYLTSRLGLPLYWAASKCIGDVSDAEEANDLVNTSYNPVLNHLAMQKFTGGRWGIPSLAEFSRPDVMLWRADGKPLRTEHVTAMWVYIDEELTKVKMAADLKPPHRIDYEAFLANMTTEKFVERWEKDVGPRLASGECPIKAGCNTCHKTGVALSKCGKCEGAKYCGRDCQKSDWALHKKFCKKY